MVGYVHCALLSAPDYYLHRASCGFNADLMMKTYRGACTVQDWSNTTACPVQWFNDGEDFYSLPIFVLFAIVSIDICICILCMVTAADSLSSGTSAARQLG